MRKFVCVIDGALVSGYYLHERDSDMMGKSAEGGNAVQMSTCVRYMHVTGMDQEGGKLH